MGLDNLSFDEQLKALIEGAKRKASYGDTGESVVDWMAGDRNTFGRDDKPQGIKATYVETDNNKNTYAGMTPGQTVSRKPYEEAKERSPVSTAVGAAAGSTLAQLPVFLLARHKEVPAQLMRNYFASAGEHAVSEEQGDILKKARNTSKWTFDHPIQTALNTLLPTYGASAAKLAGKSISKLLGRAPKEVKTIQVETTGELPANDNEIEDIMTEIAEYEATHGPRRTLADKQALVDELLGKRYARDAAKYENLPEVASRNAPRNTNAQPPLDPSSPATPKLDVDDDEDDLMGGDD